MPSYEAAYRVGHVHILFLGASLTLYRGLGIVFLYHASSPRVRFSRYLPQLTDACAAK